MEGGTVQITRGREPDIHMTSIMQLVCYVTAALRGGRSGSKRFKRSCSIKYAQYEPFKTTAWRTSVTLLKDGCDPALGTRVKRNGADIRIEVQGSVLNKASHQKKKQPKGLAYYLYVPSYSM